MLILFDCSDCDDDMLILLYVNSNLILGHSNIIMTHMDLDYTDGYLDDDYNTYCEVVNLIKNMIVSNIDNIIPHIRSNNLNSVHSIFIKTDEYKLISTKYYQLKNHSKTIKRILPILFKVSNDLGIMDTLDVNFTTSKNLAIQIINFYASCATAKNVEDINAGTDKCNNEISIINRTISFKNKTCCVFHKYYYNPIFIYAIDGKCLEDKYLKLLYQFNKLHDNQKNLEERISLLESKLDKTDH